jgi:hypothetical protein
MKSADNFQHLVGKTLIESDQEANFQRTDEHVCFYLVLINNILILYIYI